MTRGPLRRRLRGKSPREAGYRWPAEWARHEAMWLAWPHDPTTWPDCLPLAEAAFAQMAAALARGEDVHLLCASSHIEARARAAIEAERPGRRAAARIQFHRLASEDAWLRDTGPIVVTRGRGASRERLALDWRFNAWGRKYEELLADDGVARRIARRFGLRHKRINLVLEGGSIDGDGQGTILTTEQCLLHPNRNPELTREELAWHLREALGATRVLWLGEGIAGDDTDGHVDDITRFVAPGVVVTAVEPNTHDANHAPLADNVRRLRAMSDARGRALEVIGVPMPEPVYAAAGHRLPASHANFLIGNRVVLVPVFGGASDPVALRTLRRLFPRRDVVPIRCERLIEGMGALHCLSQHLPR